MAQVHRFNDAVAVSLGSGDTVYLTPKDALNIAKAIERAGADIVRREFTKGMFRTYRRECPDAKYMQRIRD